MKYIWIVAIILLGCFDKQETKGKSTNEIQIETMVVAKPKGLISTKSYIDIEFEEWMVEPHFIGVPLEDNPFEFKPSLKGEARWIGQNILRYEPLNNRLPPGTEISAKLFGSKIGIESKYIGNFEFDFKVVEQEVIGFEGGFVPDTTGKNKVRFEGEIEFAQEVSLGEIKSNLEANLKGEAFRYELKPGNTKTKIKINSLGIKRPKSEKKLVFELSPKYTGDQNEYTKTFYLVEKNNFKILSSIEEPDPNIEEATWAFRFSDAIKKGIDVTSLISIEPSINFKAQVDGKHIRVKGAFEAGKSYSASIDQNLKSVYGIKTGKVTSHTLKFSNEKPSLEWLGKGVFLPEESQYKIQLRSMNVAKVRVTVKEIKNQNLIFFAQKNPISKKKETTGYYSRNDFNDLERVGKQVFSKVIEIPAAKNKWHKSEFDLSQYLKKTDDAAWVVKVQYSESNLLGQCVNEIDEVNSAALYYESDDYYSNPCRSGYYYSKGNKERLIIQSNIGVTVKQSRDAIHLWANDVSDLKSISGLSLNLYNYQNEIIETAKTNSDGYASFTKKDGRFIKGKSNQGMVLLKLNKSPWMISNFDVGGVAEGTSKVKVYSYLDRGVHRPGDTLYLSSIIRLNQKIPENGQQVELKVINPLNQKVLLKTKKIEANGHVSFKIPTEINDPTGNWRAEIKFANNVVSKRLKIETIKPNRLKVKMDVPESFDSDIKSITGTLESKYLFGAPAKNLNAKVRVELTSETINFVKWPKYTFSHDINNTLSVNKLIVDSRLSASGTMPINYTIPKLNNSSSNIKGVLNTKIFEKGGSFTRHKKHFVVEPFESVIGYEIGRDRYVKMNEKLPIKIISVNNKGKLVKNKSVRVRVYSNPRHWWWHYDNRNRKDFRMMEHTILLSEKIINTQNGKVNHSIIPEDNGKHLIEFKDLSSGHEVGFFVYASRWGDVSKQENEEPHLKIKSKKSSYNVGDTVTVDFEAGKEGRALVSLERGETLFDSRWVEAKDGKVETKFVLTKEMLPNIYAVVSYMQPHQQVNNDQPMRSYGVLPISIKDQSTLLEMEMETPKVIEPESEFFIEVKNKSDQKVSYTLAVVDEGLLDLTQFKTPDPWRYFFQKMGLTMKTIDNLDDIIGGLLPDIDSYFKIGGGSSQKKKRGDSKSRRFKAVSLNTGVQYLKPNEKKKIKFKMPNYMGSVRVMLVSTGGENYSNLEETVTVKSPIVMLPTVPRVARPTDRFKVPVSVFALDDKIKKVNIKLEASNHFKVIGASNKTMTFSSQGEKDDFFELEVLQTVGTGKIKISASGNGEKAYKEIELPINAFNPHMTNVGEELVEGKGQLDTLITPFGIEGTRESFVKISRMPDLRLEKKMKDLIRYPYGCIEQTTSAVFPQLYIDDFKDLSGYKKEQVRQNVNAAIKRLKNFQTTSGGFSYWPQSNYSRKQVDEWGTNYAGHFLIEAKKMGFDVPDHIMKPWIKYQKEKLRSNSKNGYRNKPYRIYLLAMMNEANLGAMNLLKENSLKDLDPLSKELLASSYFLLGKKDEAKLIANHFNPHGGVSNDARLTYGSSLRDLAFRAKLSYERKDKVEMRNLFRQLQKEVVNSYWTSTQEMAYILLAYSKYLKSDTPVAGDVKIKLSVDGDEETLKLTGQNIKRKLDPNKGVNIKLLNKGDRDVFISIYQEGIPIGDVVKDESKGINMRRYFYNLDGSTLDPKNIKQGEEFYIRYRVSNSAGQNLSELALSSKLPAGWEIVNQRLNAGSRIPWQRRFKINQFDYLDIRDDRVNWFFDLNRNREKDFLVKVHPTFSGKFKMPSVTVEAMYSPDYYARIKSDWVTID